MNLGFTELVGIFLILLVSIVSSSMFVVTGVNCKLKFTGTVWGIKVPLSAGQRVFVIANWVLLVLSLVTTVVTAPMVFMSLITLLITNFKLVLLYFVLWFVCALVSGIIAFVVSKHSPLLEKANNTAVLGSLPFFQSVEEQLDEATTFVVSFEGIALMDRMNYCYAVERFEDHRMGSLTRPSEVAMVGMYFVQKYHDKFTYKVDVEVIPGTPGQTVTMIGSGGINFAHVQGTPDQRLFRSYIFTRK